MRNKTLSAIQTSRELYRRLTGAEAYSQPLPLDLTG